MTVTLTHKAILIAGPTASGKTGVSLALAEKLSGEVVNADSMQVYRDLSVLTARPDAEEAARAPHHLFGHVDASERYSVGRWLEEALAAIADIDARGKTPILVGGTGLYYRALTEGLAEIPEPDADARARARAVLEEGGPEALAREAARLDPDAAAKVEAADRQRLLRIVSVSYATGAPLSALRADTRPALAPGSWRGMVLTVDRDVLAGRIARRLSAMAEEGALEEVAALTARGLDPDLPAMKALGVEPLAAYLRGELGLAGALEQAAAQTRRYAKRQRTWFRNQTPDWPRVAADGGDAAAMVARVIDAE